MNKRRRNTKESNNLKIISYILIGCCISLLLASFITKKDPAAVLNDIVQYAMGNKDKITKNDKEWELYLAQKNSNIDSLNTIIKSYEKQVLPPYTTVNTTSTGLNLRSLPSTNGEVIAKLTNGDTVNLIYKDNELLSLGSASGYWVKVEYQGKSGYVFSSYLDHFNN